MSRSIVLGLGLCLLAAPVLAQGTAQQRIACTPDVMRLCSGDIPNVPAIIACLKRERPRVSQACQQAMYPQGEPVEVAANASRRAVVR